MGDVFSTVVQAFTLPKLIYSVILIGIVALLLSELNRLWLDGKTYISPFRAYDAGKIVDGGGDTFVMRVIDYHNELAGKLSAAEGRASEAERTWSPHVKEPLLKPDSLLADLDIQVQSINITDILGRLRAWVSAPNEITGILAKTGDLYRVSMSLPARGAMASSGGQTIQDAGLASEEEAALQVACSLIWVEAAAQGEAIQKIGRDEFCHWARVWSQTQDFSAKRALFGGFGDAEAAELVKLRGLVTQWIDGGARYPMFYSLRADIIEMMPEAARQPFVQEMIGDRWRYAVLVDLDPKSQPSNPLNTDAALGVLARARPAIVLKDGAPSGEVLPEWKKLLEPALDNIKGIARSVGAFRIKSKAGTDFSPYMGSGFVVAPNVFLVPRFALQVLPDAVLKDAVFPMDIPEGYTLSVGFGDTFIDGKPFPVSRIVYAGPEEGNSFALLEIAGSDAPPPLRLQLSKPSASLSGNYAALVGYPSADARMPPAFVQALLGKDSGVKRLMPGRIVADVTTEDSPVVNESVIKGLAIGLMQYDMSTTGGTAGGPVVDLVSNRVVAWHTAGQWKDDGQGKIALGVPVWRPFDEAGLPDDLKQAIRQASQ